MRDRRRYLGIVGNTLEDYCFPLCWLTKFIGVKILNNKSFSNDFVTRLFWIFVVSILLTACGTMQKTSQPGLAPTYPSAIQAVTSTIIPALTTTNFPADTPRYTITIFNRYDWGLHLFMDSAWIMEILPGRSGSYSGVPAGDHKFRYCHDTQGADCLNEFQLDILYDSVWTTDDSAALLPTGIETQPVASLQSAEIITTLAATATATAAPYISTLDTLSQPTSTSTASGLPIYGTPSIATLTAVAPTLAALAPTLTAVALTPLPPTATSLPPELDSFTITVHNRYPTALRFYVDGKYLMTVPSMRYLYHLHIRGGWRILKFCPELNPCFEREIFLDKDYETVVG